MTDQVTKFLISEISHAYEWMKSFFISCISFRYLIVYHGYAEGFCKKTVLEEVCQSFVAVSRFSTMFCHINFTDSQFWDKN